jgi:hypothetical protein
MTIDAYIRSVASEPVGHVPRTLEDVMSRRIKLDAYATDTTGDTRFTPRVVWRLAWLSLRQLQLIPTLLPDARVTAACAAYSEHLIAFAGRLNRELPHDAPQPKILRQYFAESADFWRSLEALVQRIGVGRLEWIERDVASLLWIRLCIFYACVSVTQPGRLRSRREIAEILANALTEFTSATSIRLRVAPAIERDLELADRWADLCGARWRSGGAAISVEMPRAPARIRADSGHGDDLSDRWTRYLGRREVASRRGRQPSGAG